MPGEKVANEDRSQLLTSCFIEVVGSQKAINSVRKISKELIIARKFFENLRTILGLTEKRHKKIAKIVANS